MIEISVKSKRYNCLIQLKQKVTVIVGDSGRGKTVFIKAISRVNEGYKIAISDSEYEISELNQNWYDVMYAGIKNKSKRIYVIDDMDFIITKEFSHLFKQDETCYYILINRLQNIALKSLNRIAFSVNEVYRFCTNGKNHWLEKFYKYEKRDIQKGIINYIIVEDRKSGFEFFEQLMRSIFVDTSDGKDKMFNYLIEHLALIKNKNILMIIDWAAFGSWYQIIYEYIIEQKLNVTVLSRYNSFEYLLLTSNMFRYDFSKLTNEDIASSSSFETLCEKILINLTKNKFYSYSKEHLNSCYSKDCCFRAQKLSGTYENACDRGLSGSKLVSLLEGTEFELLLNI